MYMVSVRPRLLLTKKASSYQNLTCHDPFSASLNEGTVLWVSDETGSLKASYYIPVFCSVLFWFICFFFHSSFYFFISRNI